MRWWNSRSRNQKVAIAVVVLAIVAVGGVAAQQLTRDEPAKPRTTSSGTEETAAKSVGKLLKLGTVARISSNYKVAVTELTLFVGGETQYLAATIEAEYTGSEKGEPWGDLTVEFSRPGSRIVGESDCPIDVDDASKPPPLAPGETGTHSVCIYLPSKKIDDGRISVEEALSKGGRKAYWSTKGAETEVLPSFAPPPSGVRQPNTSFRAPKANRVDEDWVEEYIEEVEEYKDWVAEMNEFAEENKDNPGFDEDDIEKYEEWKKEYDEQIEEYEKWKKEYEASR